MRRRRRREKRREGRIGHFDGNERREGDGKTNKNGRMEV